MGIDIGFQNNARYWKLVHKKVTKRWYQRYLNGLAVMFFLPRFFLAWYFKCPELTQPLSHDSSKNQTAYQKDIVEQNLAQVFIWTGIHCFVSSVNWFRLCKTKYVTDVSGTDEIFALMCFRTRFYGAKLLQLLLRYQLGTIGTLTESIRGVPKPCDYHGLQMSSGHYFHWSRSFGESYLAPQLRAKSW